MKLIDRCFQWTQSIFAKQLASYILIILLLSSSISLMFFSTARKHLEVEIGTKLQDIAQIAARNTPFERLNLIRIGDDDTRMVLRLKQKLSEIQEATGLKNIYIFTPQMHSLLDLIPDRRIGFSYNLPEFSPSFMTSLSLGHPVHTTGYVKNQDDFFISAYAPVLDKASTLFAVVAVDAGTEQLKIIEQMRIRLYWISLFAVGFAFLLALYFTRSITSPIRHITHIAERFGSGDYDVRVSVNSPDELGLLSTSINRMAEQVHNRDIALKEMSATVAHEIRNPLNSMKLLISLLEEELTAQNNATQTTTIQTLYYEISKLNRFINEFLTYARPVTLVQSRISPDSLITRVLEMATGDAQENQVQLGHKRSGALPDMMIDGVRMEQVLLNLVINAIQACPYGGRVTISACLSNSPDGMNFVIEDTGPGIDAEAFSNLFEPFFTTKEDGTGLGLSNSARIVEAYQGTIKAENPPEGGARFTVQLPCRTLIQ